MVLTISCSLALGIILFHFFFTSGLFRRGFLRFMTLFLFASSSSSLLRRRPVCSVVVSVTLSAVFESLEVVTTPFGFSVLGTILFHGFFTSGLFRRGFLRFKTCRLIASFSSLLRGINDLVEVSSVALLFSTIVFCSCCFNFSTTSTLPSGLVSFRTSATFVNLLKIIFFSL